MRRSTTMMALVGLASSLVACAPRYDGFDCEMVNQTPSGALCTDSRIEVSRGEALVIRLEPVSESNTEYEDADIELRPVDNQMIDVRPGTNDLHTIIGLTLGDTELEVWVDGELQELVPARIVPADSGFSGD